jgi:hypothetical protein
VNSLAAAAASSSTAPDTASTGIEASAIPYRTTSSVSVGGVAGASVITAFVLVVLVGCLIYARRRGWAVVGVTPLRRATNDADLFIVATKRLSVASVGHVVSYRGNEYLIVESAKGFQAAIVPLHSRDNPKDEAP